MFAQLGKVQERVLHYLAYHPKQNTQTIQRSLNIPDRDYSSVRNAVLTLQQVGLLKAEAVQSQKKVTIQAYSLTTKGLAYFFSAATILAEEELNLIIDNYYKERETEMMKLFHKKLGTSLMLKTLKHNAVMEMLAERDPSIATLVNSSCFMARLAVSPEETKKIGEAVKALGAKYAQMPKTPKDIKRIQAARKASKKMSKMFEDLDASLAVLEVQSQKDGES